MLRRSRPLSKGVVGRCERCLNIEIICIEIWIKTHRVVETAPFTINNHLSTTSGSRASRKLRYFSCVKINKLDEMQKRDDAVPMSSM